MRREGEEEEKAGCDASILGEKARCSDLRERGVTYPKTQYVHDSDL